jgi:DNA-binding HxlR family transcriptional regulator
MDLTGWLDYFVEGLATQMNEVTERGKRAIRRDVIAREYALNPRQVLAVGHLLERDELRIEELEVLCPGVNRRTLSRTLKVRGGIISQANRYLGGFCSSQEIFPPQIIQLLLLQRDLRDLVQQGVVKSIGAARAVRYVLQIRGL